MAKLLCFTLLCCLVGLLPHQAAVPCLASEKSKHRWSLTSFLKRGNDEGRTEGSHSTGYESDDGIEFEYTAGSVERGRPRQQRPVTYAAPESRLDGSSRETERRGRATGTGNRHRLTYPSSRGDEAIRGLAVHPNPSTSQASVEAGSASKSPEDEGQHAGATRRHGPPVIPRPTFLVPWEVESASKSTEDGGPHGGAQPLSRPEHPSVRTHRTSQVSTEGGRASESTEGEGQQRGERTHVRLRHAPVTLYGASQVSGGVEGASGPTQEEGQRAGATSRVWGRYPPLPPIRTGSQASAEAGSAFAHLVRGSTRHSCSPQRPRTERPAEPVRRTKSDPTARRPPSFVEKAKQRFRRRPTEEDSVDYKARVFNWLATWHVRDPEDLHKTGGIPSLGAYVTVLHPNGTSQTQFRTRADFRQKQELDKVTIVSQARGVAMAKALAARDIEQKADILLGNWID